MKDILEDLKKMPYTVPEGYFETFEERVRPWETENGNRGWPAKVTPYLSMAAMFAIIVAVGSAIITSAGQDAGSSEYEDYLYCNLIRPSGSLTAYYSYDEDTYELSEEDIIQYLIYSGTDTEEIEK